MDASGAANFVQYQLQAPFQVLRRIPGPRFAHDMSQPLPPVSEQPCQAGLIRSACMHVGTKLGNSSWTLFMISGHNLVSEIRNCYLKVFAPPGQVVCWS